MKNQILEQKILDKIPHFLGQIPKNFAKMWTEIKKYLKSISTFLDKFLNRSDYL